MYGKINGYITSIMRSRFLDLIGLSIESGVSEEKLSAYIYHGEKAPIWDAQKIAEALNVDLDLIFDK